MPRNADTPKKTPAEQLEEVRSQIRGVDLRVEELSLHRQTLALRERKILNKHPELATEEPSNV